MRHRRPLFAALTAALALGGASAFTVASARPQQAPAPAAANTWSAAGTLLESCTCAVPCTCNFGEGPSPHPYCHAVFSYKLDKASVGGVDLSGLTVGGADGPDGGLGFLDARATPQQKAALERAGRLIFAQGGPAGGPRRWVSAPIEHSVSGNDLRLKLGDNGGFSARVIVGRDGKSPVVVENNTVWPIRRATKAKASSLRFSAPGVGKVSGAGVNANYGAFSFSGPLGSGESIAVASAAPASPPAKGAGCCGTEAGGRPAGN